jgi:hypothetical protein
MYEDQQMRPVETILRKENDGEVEFNYDKFEKLL